jgi:hypothetical protein
MKITKQENNKIEITLDNGCVVEVRDRAHLSAEDSKIKSATITVDDPPSVKSKRSSSNEVDSIHITTNRSGIAWSTIHTDDEIDNPVTTKSIQRKTITLNNDDGSFLSKCTRIWFNKNRHLGFSQSIFTSK